MQVVVEPNPRGVVQRRICSPAPADIQQQRFGCPQSLDVWNEASWSTPLQVEWRTAGNSGQFARLALSLAAHLEAALSRHTDPPSSGGG